ncbi:hypothetical protein [Argonema galeatum]|uniref:hypothetical protein n=1 Tax=Argonema galeatum TaxID=2942762 RepID=UPI002012AF50|nr:hypothetical protein [Argonema galeatum]MCL1468067.1 hypothetical protein [Argonema galeatum A003/A1]
MQASLPPSETSTVGNSSGKVVRRLPSGAEVFIKDVRALGSVWALGIVVNEDVTASESVLLAICPLEMCDRDRIEPLISFVLLVFSQLLAVRQKNIYVGQGEAFRAKTYV